MTSFSWACSCSILSRPPHSSTIIATCFEILGEHLGEYEHIRALIEMLINICAFHLVHLRELFCCRQDVAHTIEDNADSLVILGGEQVAEGLEHTLAAQVDDLRHLSSAIRFTISKDSNKASTVPPLVKFVIAHAASFCALKSP